MSAAQVAPLPRTPLRVRIVTAASLFDGHDAAINIMRRILQSQGAEVIHLGHDRSVDEIVEAAIEEDAHAVAVSSYQGGHMEFFRYMVDRLRERGAGEVRVYGGGGGTIVPDEIAALHEYGVARIFSPEDGRSLGLEGMIRSIVEECRRCPGRRLEDEVARLAPEDPRAVARTISWLEEHGPAGGVPVDALRRALVAAATGHPPAPVIGFTGTGGAGKSSVVDEIVRRFRRDNPLRHVALVLVDPTRRRSGGALLGDRIRMNAIQGPHVYVRSLATRQAHLALSHAVRDAVSVLQAARFDLIFVETAGIGQSDSEIVDLADTSLYVMTPDFGAPSQLEKIDMLELADLVVLNKSDRQGAEDALRDVRKQWQRNHTDYARSEAQIPVFASVASQWDDPGLDRVYEALQALWGAREGVVRGRRVSGAKTPPRAAAAAAPPRPVPLIPAGRERYLEEIARTVRSYRKETSVQAERARCADQLAGALEILGDAPEAVRGPLAERHEAALAALDPALREALEAWPKIRGRYEGEEQRYRVRGHEIPVRNHVETLSGTALPKVAVPQTRDWGELVRYLRQEGLPGYFPFTAGVFPLKSTEEDPARMFAGEGGPERTNRRFHLLAAGQPATRLSTAFDSVTLYGRDPSVRPDVYGKVGTSGVSICSLDDAKKLYSGFDLCDRSTSVSMTINGPAPMLLALFLNTAIDQAVERHLREHGDLEAVRASFRSRGLPEYQGDLPATHDGLGLGLLGIDGAQAVDTETYARIRAQVLKSVRGTVQADILKEDQAQNTCIFSTHFALKMMGDI